MLRAIGRTMDKHSKKLIGAAVSTALGFWIHGKYISSNEKMALYTKASAVGDQLVEPNTRPYRVFIVVNKNAGQG